MKKIFIVSLVFIGFIAKAQDDANRVITTAVPFLLIAADARSAGMGDIGVVSSADAFSQQYNPAKYAFSLREMGFSASYTPYLSQIAEDIALGQATFFKKINEQSAAAASIRYFSLGEIELRDNFGVAGPIVKPNELALDGSYSLKLSEQFAMAVAGRYIRSQLRIPSDNADVKPASSFAVDVAGYWQSEEQSYSDFNGRWKAGFNFQNLGPKISYDNDKVTDNFLPANLRLGTGFDFIFDDYNRVSTMVEFTKLLVPTPQDFDDDGDMDALDNEEYRKIGWVSGIFKSFNDAPDGFSEELKEFTYSVGAEYMYQDTFAMRLGYFNENELKGARKFFTLGAGFKYNTVKIDVSYLFSASKVKNPLENTLRFSLSFAFGDEYDEY